MQLKERVNTANKNKLRSKGVLQGICHVRRAIRGHVKIGQLKVSENLTGLCWQAAHSRALCGAGAATLQHLQPPPCSVLCLALHTMNPPRAVFFGAP